MTEYLKELYAHQHWADAEHWSAFEAHPIALSDRAIRERLHHIWLVQEAFLWAIGPRDTQFAFAKIERSPDIMELKTLSQKYHVAITSVLDSFHERRLSELVEIPWFTPALKISVRHALTQAAMHSHYHRGQNATRLRELGGVPPYTDFIVWLRNGQPSAQWS
jgi:uncharacterized damage-inducible protein DinB